VKQNKSSQPGDHTARLCFFWDIQRFALFHRPVNLSDFLSENAYPGKI